MKLKLRLPWWTRLRVLLSHLKGEDPLISTLLEKAKAHPIKGMEKVDWGRVKKSSGDASREDVISAKFGTHSRITRIRRNARERWELP